MNHFLNHLITRSLSPPEQSQGEVRPRLTSLFEPVVPRMGATVVGPEIFSPPGAEWDVDERDEVPFNSPESPESEGNLPHSSTRLDPIFQVLQVEADRKPVSRFSGVPHNSDVQSVGISPSIVPVTSANRLQDDTAPDRGVPSESSSTGMPQSATGDTLSPLEQVPVPDASASPSAHFSVQALSRLQRSRSRSEMG